MRTMQMGARMANKEMTHENCHICGDSWDVDFMIDDEPNGMICVPCNDIQEQMLTEFDEMVIH